MLLATKEAGKPPVADITPVSNKRSASSPVEATEVKNHRTESAKEDWHIVKNKKKRD